MILLISTYDNSHFAIAVGEEKILRKKIVRKSFQQSELLLFEIDKLIQKNKLKNIIVVSGPGAFSGLRIGIATANALAYALKIPVVGVELKKSWLKLKPQDLVEKVWKQGIEKLQNHKVNDFVLPYYDQEPNIG